MRVNIWFILGIAAVLLAVIIVVPNVVAKMMGGLLLLMLLAYLGEVAREESEQIDKMQRALDKLRNAYSELDEQAKIIIRTDLELNRTQEELDKKINGLYTLHELGKLINATLDVQKLFSQISEPLILKLGFEKTIIFLREGDPTEIICKAAIGFNQEKIDDISHANENYPLLQNVFSKGNSVWVKNRENVSEDQLKLLDLFEVSSFVIVPMTLKETVEGYLFVGNSSPYNYLSEGDMDSLFILSNQLGVALENARLYEELKLSHDELEVRVEERTKELAEANKKLLELNKMKSDFVSAVSHELRTPLTSIKGYAAILGTGRLGDVSPVQAEKLQKINIHSDELIKLVNDLLDIARIESGKIGMSIKYANLNDIVNSVADLFFPQSDERKVTLAVEMPEGPLMAWVDPSQISRVFINLIGNAMKFTPEGGTITIRVRLIDEQLMVEIHDTGIGISAEDASHIFDEFYRVDNAINVQKKGTGLGLSLVKKIVEAHKGRIWVTSELGRGTSFHFTLSTKKIEDSQVSIN